MRQAERAQKISMDVPAAVRPPCQITPDAPEQILSGQVNAAAEVRGKERLTFRDLHGRTLRITQQGLPPPPPLRPHLRQGPAPGGHAVHSGGGTDQRQNRVNKQGPRQWRGPICCAGLFWQLLDPLPDLLLKILVKEYLRQQRAYALLDLLQLFPLGYVQQAHQEMMTALLIWPGERFCRMMRMGTPLSHGCP